MKPITNRIALISCLSLTLALSILGQPQVIAKKQPVTSQTPATIWQLDNTDSSQPWTRVVLKQTLTGNKAVVNSLLFSPDSNILLSGGSTNDPVLRVWNLAKSEEIDHLRAQRTAILALAISPDGTNLVSSGADGAVNIWDWTTGTYQATFLEHKSNVLDLAISPDSKILVSGGLDGIKVWNLKPRKPYYTLTSFGNPSYALAIHPNGYLLASGNNKGEVEFWNLRTGERISTFKPHQEAISNLIFSPDGKTIISGSYDHTIKIWDATTGKLKYTLSGHTARIRDLVLNSDGITLASASDDGVRLWNIDTGELLNYVSGHHNWVESLAFSPDGKMLATGGYDFTIKIWQYQ